MENWRELKLLDACAAGQASKVPIPATCQRLLEKDVTATAYPLKPRVKKICI